MNLYIEFVQCRFRKQLYFSSVVRPSHPISGTRKGKKQKQKTYNQNENYMQSMQFIQFMQFIAELWFNI